MRPQTAPFGRGLPFGFVTMHRTADPQFFDLLVGSYRRLIGEDPPFLPQDAPHTARWLYADAPSPVLAHNTKPDPGFIYANKAAQKLFGYDWDEIIGLPSRHLAAVPARDERQRLLDAVARDGYATGYSGIRIAKSGRRFWIEDGVLWQLRTQDGALRGVTATFANWRDA